MARRQLLLTLLATFIASPLLLSARAAAPSPAPDCVSLVFSNLMSCLGYALNGSNDTKPSKECCKGVSSFVKEEPNCICVLLRDPSAASGVNINITRAMELPAVCKSKVDFGHCKAEVASAPSPLAHGGGGEGGAPGPSGRPGVAAPPPASAASTFRVLSSVLVAAMSAVAFAML